MAEPISDNRFYFILIVRGRFVMPSLVPPFREVAQHLVLIAALLATLALTGCATNPVTGKKDIALMSESAEIAQGKRSHAGIIKQFGRYPDEALQAYVTQVGERLAKKSHRSNLEFHFTVLDSADVNAFALPGGYIYVTRGILAYLNSEAELAGVLGHEIGHVTARHGVQQQGEQALAGLVGMAVAIGTGSRAATDLTQLLGTALVKGYGRKRELEADRLGAEYLARTGYEPKAMIDVIRVLKNQEIFERQLAKSEGRKPRGSYSGLFASHPDNDTRLQQVVGEANSKVVKGKPVVGHAVFIRKLNKLTFGDSPSQGVIRGQRFFHADMGFALEFPADWKIENRPDQVLAVAPQGNGQIQLKISSRGKHKTPQALAASLLHGARIQHGEAIRGRSGSWRGYTGVVDAKTAWGQRKLRFVVIFMNRVASDQAFVLLSAAKNVRKPYQYDRATLQTANSFHALKSSEAKLAQGLQLRSYWIRSGMSFRLLARRSPLKKLPEQQLRLINGLYPKGEAKPGSWIKIVE